MSFENGNAAWKRRKMNKGGRPRKHRGDVVPAETSQAIDGADVSSPDDVADTVAHGDDVSVVGDEDERELVPEIKDEAELGYLQDIANPKKRALLSAYAQTGSLTKAARTSGYSMSSHYHWLDTDPQYVKAYGIAKQMFSERLIETVHERALREDKPSDLMMIFSLKGLRPEYRDNFKPEINVNIANINATKEQFDFEKFRRLLR